MTKARARHSCKTACCARARTSSFSARTIPLAASWPKRCSIILPTGSGHAIRAYSAGSATSGRSIRSRSNACRRGYRNFRVEEQELGRIQPSRGAAFPGGDHGMRPRGPESLSASIQGTPVRVHWGYPDPSNVSGNAQRSETAFELTRQAIGYRMLQLIAALPVDG